MHMKSNENVSSETRKSVLRAGLPPCPASVTVNRAARTFRRSSEARRNSFRQSCLDYMVAQFGDIPVSKVSPAMVRRAISKLRPTRTRASRTNAQF
jgi:hypothetical protein